MSKTCPETVEQVMLAPDISDVLCYDGEQWRVARRHGWHYPVNAAQTSNFPIVLPPLEHAASSASQNRRRV